MMTKRLINFILLTSFIIFGLGTIQAQNDAGKKLFELNCTTCHKVGDDFIGPALGPAKEKYAEDKDFLYEWVKNADPKSSAKAQALSETFTGIMTGFPMLSNEDIDNIIDYSEWAMNNPPAPKGDVIAVSQGSSNPMDNPTIYYSILALLAVLALIAFFLVLIAATLVTAVKAKDEGRDFYMSEVWDHFRNFLKNKFVITFIICAMIMGSAVKISEWVRGAVSIHQGYMPVQPIKYSHKLHAGEYGIACEYCHSGARKSKNAWIPSVNVCMNCHSTITSGPKYGKEEIAKVRDAYKSGTPIQWVRIHNLPDHVYFNHSQHTEVGNVECQTCHGPIEEMEVVYQYATLGMGWCINCHRTEKVKSIGGASNSKGLTVDDMGGLDCVRCHY